MTNRRLALLIAALAVAGTLASLYASDSPGLLGRFGIGPPPK
jgi:hypothetical protein